MKYAYHVQSSDDGVGFVDHFEDDIDIALAVVMDELEGGSEIMVHPVSRCTMDFCGVEPS